MSLEANGYIKAKYHGKIHNIYSEPNYEDYTIELIDGDGCVFEVKLCDVDLIKKKKSRG